MLTPISRAFATAAAAVIALSTVGLASVRAADYGPPVTSAPPPAYAPPQTYAPPPTYEVAPVEVAPIYPPPVYVVPTVRYPYYYRHYGYAPVYRGPPFAPRGRYMFRHYYR